ncbi:Tyrosine-protein phosphatase 2,Tyrosine-protein phosphatase corkscrew,Tyrosine-protein phosphatase non-receptor type 6 [Mytilus coruscus]|uniref:protein-tyrosine-phosphatase n=1 Tax=Mytilus coruscus TaxID=42192 RepID=A0A6J8C017_MYTCO|nr:Tyrosine-protein phosphatase 2,Tyrosine-protein phosphatase corkscrew,Tyrosine-protein phosphatase non-receptor type 6 [Mytilus coruscus]
MNFHLSNNDVNKKIPMVNFKHRDVYDYVLLIKMSIVCRHVMYFHCFIASNFTDNLTPNGTATQSSLFHVDLGYPENAINPPITNQFTLETCSHTRDEGAPAWWMFEFSFGSAHITDITIYYRQGLAVRMDGFKLYVTNTSAIPPDGYLCYADPDPGLPNITQTIPCNYLGKYVIYYDTTGSKESGNNVVPYVELCYVAIKGCQTSYWGRNCENVCAVNCIEQHCYPGNGSCVWGCNPKNCLNDICNKDTAVCTDGCKKRRTGSYCNEYNVAYHGSVFQYPSGSQPAELANDGEVTSCSKTKGINITFQVDLKNKSILTGMYITFGGVTTKEVQQIVYASNNSYSWNTGKVLYNGTSLPSEMRFNVVFRYLTYVTLVQAPPSEIEICDIGIFGCPPTHYGPCRHVKSRHVQKMGMPHGPCDGLENGHVYTFIFNRNVYVTACQPGDYGKNCREKCSTNCIILPCNHVTGGCNGDCNDGWHGFNCYDKCSYGQFGRNCSHFCEGCFLGMCDPVNGLCDNASICSPGYIYGAYCNITCDDGYFGNNCTRLCNCATGKCSAFTGNCPGGCAKGWRGEACDEVKSALQPEESSQAGAIGGGFAAVIIVLIMVAAFIVYKRRFMLTKDTKKETKTGNDYANVNVGVVFDAQEEAVSLRDKRDNEFQAEEYEDGNVYNNVPSEHNVFKYKILIEDLKEAISEKQKDEGFRKEYEVLPRGLVCAHVEGSKAQNKEKNRFFTTWPCPKMVTIRDFWHMIWQENVGKIVMVTQLEENKKKKCERYWPETVNEPMVVDNYIVTMKEYRKHTVYVYRLLTVSNKNVKNVKEREIHHFHFTEWPDHGVPDSIKVVNFYRKVKSKACDQLGPMVVHCSAGIGRTGTFIAIDALYENGKKVGYINVMECIQMMRKDRMNMVQTYEQYEAIFEALLELLRVPDTSIPKKEFCQYISDQEQKKLPRNQKLYKLEFQRLETLRPVYPPSAFSAATSKENISKNSIKKIFPLNRYRPYTMSYGRTRTDYINAVIIPEYTNDSKILVTQCPLEETVVDFWTMVHDHKSPIVVLLDQLNTNAPLWLGRQEVLEFKQFTILQENSPNPEELKLTLSHKEKDPMAITVFTTSELNNDAMLPSKILLDLLKKVKECWEIQKSSITVVCSDGCSKSGAFVALKLVLQKMEIDDEIDVFQVVRTMQVRRPEFFSEFDQYEYCYKCIKEYLENDSVYANL